jgi:hypothetical protein
MAGFGCGVNGGWMGPGGCAGATGSGSVSTGTSVSATGMEEIVISGIVHSGMVISGIVTVIGIGEVVCPPTVTGPEAAVAGAAVRLLMQ